MDFLWSLFHPEEIYHLLRFKMGAYRPAVSQQEQDSMSDSLQTCYKYLNEISRSFADVIQALDQKIRDAICVFYLVLRALGTVEDDMTISLETKSPMLHNFHTNLYQMDWRFTESNERDRQVLEDFPTISQEFRNLPAVYQEVIADTCQKMGVGMAQFLEKRVESLQDWDRVTAVATLAACYNNRQVFKGVVKIRRGQAVTLMVKATNIHAVRAIVYQYVNEIDRKISMRDPSAERTKSIVSTIQKRTVSSVSPHRYSPVYP